MKTALIFFRNAINEFDGKYYSNVISAFQNGGINVETVELLSCDDERSFRHRVDEFKDTFDNLIVVVSESLAFDVKEIIAEKLETVLVENENAKLFIDAVAKTDGVDYSNSYALMPMEATVIPNVKGAFQGFIVDAREFTVVCLPEDFVALKPMCDKFVLPYLENNLQQN